ncbi:MAG: hypothetical protein ACRCYY_06115 [Trueperaceae bacterium]
MIADIELEQADGYEGEDFNDWLGTNNDITKLFANGTRLKNIKMDAAGSVTFSVSYSIGENRYHSVCPSPDLAKRITKRGDAEEVRLFKLIAHCTKIETPNGLRNLTLADIKLMSSSEKSLLAIAFLNFQAPGKPQAVFVGLDTLGFPASLLSVPETVLELTVKAVTEQLRTWLFREEPKPNYTLEQEVKATPPPPLQLRPQIAPRSPNIAA